MAFDCIQLGDSLYQNGDGDLDVLLAPDSGLEILPGGEGVGGLNIVDEQRTASWATYTPTFAHVAASVYTPWSTVGNAVYSFRWVRDGNSVHVHCVCQLGSTTVFGGGSGGAMCFSLPVPAHSSYITALPQVLGRGTVVNSGVASAPCNILLTDDRNHFAFTWTTYSTTVADSTYVTGASPFGWGANDWCAATFMYEAA